MLSTINFVTSSAVKLSLILLTSVTWGALRTIIPGKKLFKQQKCRTCLQRIDRKIRSRKLVDPIWVRNTKKCGNVRRSRENVSEWTGIGIDRLTSKTWSLMRNRQLDSLAKQLKLVDLSFDCRLMTLYIPYQASLWIGCNFHSSAKHYKNHDCHQTKLLLRISNGCDESGIAGQKSGSGFEKLPDLKIFWGQGAKKSSNVEIALSLSHLIYSTLKSQISSPKQIKNIKM